MKAETLFSHLTAAALVGGVLYLHSDAYRSQVRWNDTHTVVKIPESTNASAETWQSDDGDRQQVNCLAEAMYFEAANQGEAGMTAVAAVVFNRLYARKYGQDICSVVHAHWRVATKSRLGSISTYRTHCEFSAFCEPRKAPAGPSWRLANALAWRVYLHGDKIHDKTNGAQFYMNQALTAVRWPKKQQTAQIGAHTFFKD